MPNAKYYNKKRVLETFGVHVGPAKAKPDDPRIWVVPNLYCLAYHSPRVNFHAHQRRSLALADYLAAKCKATDERKEQSIAVIGGGVGGLTCFIGLLAEGHRDVVLLERGARLISLQHGCRHRHGHPHVIDWPLSGKMDCTTDLPFMNWGAGSAADVKEQMLADPAGRMIEERFGEKIKLKKAVKTIQPLDKGNDGIRVTYGDRKSQDFDVVVCAMGFGPERNTRGVVNDGYWYDDNLEKWRDAYGGEHPIVISGGGDGALIEAARVGYATSRKTDLAVALAARARGNRYFSAPPRPRFSESPSEGQSEIEIALQNEDNDTSKPDTLFEVVQRLMDLDPAFEEHCRHLVSQADDNLKGRNFELLVVDRNNWKSFASAGMANRILFALLNGNFRTAVKVRHGHLSHSDKPGVSVGDHSVLTHLHDAVFYEDDRNNTKLGPREVYARHGPTQKGISPKQLQLGTGDVLKPPAQEGEHYDLEQTGADRFRVLESIGLLPNDPPDSSVVAIDYRARCAITFLERTLEGASVSVDYDSEKQGFFLRVAGPMQMRPGEPASAQACANRQAMLDTGGFDRTLFGAPVAYEPRADNAPVWSARAIPATAQKAEE